jgi:hypothetical protein
MISLDKVREALPMPELLQKLGMGWISRILSDQEIRIFRFLSVPIRDISG